LPAPGSTPNAENLGWREDEVEQGWYMEKEKPFWFFRRISRIRTMVLVNIFILLGALCMVIVAFLPPKYSGTHLEEFIISLSFLLIGLAGMPIIIRREVNIFLIHLEGTLAIIYGLTLLLAGLAIATIPVIGPLLKTH
jgi:hypothetical protein